MKSAIKQLKSGTDKHKREEAFETVISEFLVAVYR